MQSLSTTSIIYGTAWKRERTKSLVVSAVLAGFRAIDTACQPKHYREDLVGAALDEVTANHGINRSSLFIQTKFTPIGGQDRTRPLPYDPSRSVTEQVNQSFKRSLENLRVSYVDSYLLHSPLNSVERTLEAWKVMCNLQDEGLIKNIGVSNTYDVETLKALEEEGGRRPQVVQNRWYEGNAFDRDVLKYCREKGIYYQSVSYYTNYVLSLNRSQELLDTDGLPDAIMPRAVTALAERKGVEPAQIIYRLAQHWGIIPLAGSQNEQHMRDGVEAEKIPLTPDDVPKTVETMIFAE